MSESQTSEPIIDVDVHVSWEGEEIISNRLPKSWRHRWLHGAGHTQPGVKINPKYYDPNDSKPSRFQPADAKEWADSAGLTALILNVYDAPLLSTFGDTDYPTVVASAINDWLAEEWLDCDARFHGSIVVATQDPAAAAAEIRRAARHPRMAHVFLPNGARQPYGHRHYWPIYEAAAECGLAVAIHAGTEGMGTSGPPSPCGWPLTVSELRVTRSTIFLAHLTSLVTEGVFVRFPELRIVGLETGVAWLPAYLWRFDKNYKGLRSECPWLKELPSEYVRRFFRFGTQGMLPEGADAAEFWRLLSSVGGGGLPAYSSNYPRWDAEPPGRSPVLETCTRDKLAAVKAGNALEAYPRLN